jgi:hypothetical protein
MCSPAAKVFDQLRCLIDTRLPPWIVVKDYIEIPEHLNLSISVLPLDTTAKSHSFVVYNSSSDSEIVLQDKSLRLECQRSTLATASARH